MSSDFKNWVHTHNGHVIRMLSNNFIGSHMNALKIAFCNYEDIGEYTCIRTTNYPTLPELNITTYLSVYGMHLYQCQ